MGKTRISKPGKGLDLDVSLAWYNPGGCPLRVWPIYERVEEAGENGPCKGLIKEKPPS